MSRICVIGAGAWGTALSVALGRQHRHELHLWAYEPGVRESIRTTKTNPQFLPGVGLPEAVRVHDEIETALRGADVIVSAIPSQHCRKIFSSISDQLLPEMMIVSATKGLEQNTLLRMTEVIAATAKSPVRVGALSGPSFAAEVARGDPTAITIASTDSALMRAVQHEFSDPAFRVYGNDDVVGVELGGALKNIIAIAAGICYGLGLGHNSIAGLITRGLAEMTRLVVACGGCRETMPGLAGLGDLVLTCTGELSRNRSVGVELGRGHKLPTIISAMQGRVAEGVFTTEAAVRLARTHGVELPIIEQVYAILNEGKPPREAIYDLMTRSSKKEFHAASQEW